MAATCEPMVRTRRGGLRPGISSMPPYRGVLFAEERHIWRHALLLCGNIPVRRYCDDITFAVLK